MTQTDAQQPSPRLVSGHGLATTAADGAVLDVWFPAPVAGPLSAADASLRDTLRALAADDADRGTTQAVVELEVDLDAAPASTADAWLRLHVLSHRLVRPNELNLDGVFGLLTNVVWTNHGPCAVADFELTRARLRARGAVQVYGVDKFPRMVDYVVPSGVRIGDADRIRLGGDPDANPEQTFAGWGAALQLPAVRGLVVGRTLLYPGDDDVAAAVDTAAALVR